MNQVNRHFELIERSEKPWQIGVAIEFGNLSELNDYEDTIRDATDLGNSRHQNVFENWDGRKKLTDLIRIPKFNGRLLNIQLIPLETDPVVYEILETQRFIGGSLKTLEDTRNNPEYVNGFQFTADAHSTGRGIIGNLNSFFVYAPLAEQLNKVTRHTTPSRKLSTHPIGLRRFISKPTIQTTKYTPEEILAQSEEIALKDRRYALKRTFRA